MLLVIDVGNTNITLGVFDKEELFGTFRMKTKQPRTSDEYGITLQELVERHGIESSKINAVIIASVVPDVMHSLGSPHCHRESETGRSGPHCRCSRCVYFIRRTNNCCGFWNSNNI